MRNFTKATASYLWFSLSLNKLTQIFNLATKAKVSVRQHHYEALQEGVSGKNKILKWL